MAVGFVDVRFFGDVFEGAVAAIVVEDVAGWRETHWAAHYWDAFPDAVRAIAGSGGGGDVEVDVVGDE